MDQYEIWKIAGQILIVMAFLATPAAMAYLIIRDARASKNQPDQEQPNEEEEYED